MMSLSEFLKDLPTHNRDNFTRLQTDASGVGRPHHGQVKKDIPSPRIVPTVAYSCLDIDFFIVHLSIAFNARFL